MGRKTSGNEHLLRTKSERLERLLDLYTRGVITLDDFIRLKNEIKAPAAAAAAPAEPDSVRSGSTKKQELRQIRDEIRKREQVAVERIEPIRPHDLSLYTANLPIASSFITEPMVGELRTTETAQHHLPALADKDPEPPAVSDGHPYSEDRPLKNEFGSSRSGMFLSNSMAGLSSSVAAVRRSPRSMAALAVTFLAASVLTIGIARSGPINHIVNTLQPQNSSASTYSTPAQANLFIRPRFGPQAVKRCLDSCSRANSSDLCERACNRLTLTEYARRVTTKDISPADDAAAAASQCLNQSHRSFSEVDRADWLKTANELGEVLRHADENRTVSDFSRARLEHDRLNQLNDQLALPKQASLSERTLTAEFARASCLRVNLDLTEMALVLTNQGSDPFSERYYHHFYEQLHPVASVAEQTISELMKKISSLDHAAKSD